MLSQNEKDKLMKQIFIAVILLGLAYGVSLFPNKDVVVKEAEDKEAKIVGVYLKETKINKQKMLADLNSLDENTRKEMIELLGL